MDVASCLREVIELAVNICTTWIREGKIRKDTRLYIEHKVENFEYGINNRGAHWSSQLIHVEEWNSGDIFRLTDYLKSTVQFKRCAQTIIENYSIDPPVVDSLLSAFLRKVVTDILEGNLDLENLLVTFINDLERNPIWWKVEVWLDGIYMETELIKIEDDVIIRRPKKEDFEYRSPIAPHPFYRSPLEHFPTAIIEMYKKSDSPSNLRVELWKLFISLQLYNVASIIVTQINFKPISILEHEYTLTPASYEATTYKCTLSEEDEKSLPEFVKTIKDKLPVEERTGRPDLSHPVGIALLRYQDAVSKPEPIENKIAYAIMGLEALYLKAGENQELSHRLAQRVAKIMGMFGDPPLQARKIVKDGYVIRSKFVHGVVSKASVNKELLDTIVEYLRRSILVFMLIPKRKEEFIQMIDDSMLDEKAKEDLEQLITDRIKFLIKK